MSLLWCWVHNPFWNSVITTLKKTALSQSRKRVRRQEAQMLVLTSPQEEENKKNKIIGVYKKVKLLT